jgi:hypothetical protein
MEKFLGESIGLGFVIFSKLSSKSLFLRLKVSLVKAKKFMSNGYHPAGFDAHLCTAEDSAL